jgi:multisubunit Na+/H+ antiporter MnhG subunit
MVKTQLVFFDTYQEGLLGTARGLISFIPLVLFGIMVTNNNKLPIWKKLTGVFIISFMLCSAIAVQIPYNYTSAIIYGALVGLVVGATIFGLAISTSEDKLSRFNQLLVIIFPLLTAPLSALTFGLSTRWKLY